MKNIYITTTLPYVNAKPHIGFALEIIQADTFARFNRIINNHVFFNFGTDEHGLKIYRKALENNQDPQTYCDEYAAKFDLLKKSLNLSYNNFIRTTDPHHIKATQEFWKKCQANGDIYKKNYPVKYCVGCELEKQDSDLVNGRCPYHPNQELEILEEENYFFRWSKYQKSLLKLYREQPTFVLPETRQKEITSFVSSGLQDFSISRLKEKLPWGIPVPGDPDHVMYVWFDALINYISAIGWPHNKEKFNQWWPVIQFAGKDNLRQQSAMWQAMLMSAGLPPSKQILIHGFLSVDGQKISKSLGNVVDPIEEVKKYSTDAVRYYLLAEFNPFEDGDYSREKFENRYNADLANGLGNLVSRVAKLCEKSQLTFSPPDSKSQSLTPQVTKHLNNFQFNEALNYIWQQQISTADRYINQRKPWEQTGTQLKNTLSKLIKDILQIAFNLQPFIPETSQAIINQYSTPQIKGRPPLFPRV